MNFHPEEKWIDWVDQLSMNDFVVIDDFLPAQLYMEVRNFLLHKLEEDEFDRAGIGSSAHKLKDTSIRGDFTYWIDKERDQSLSDTFGVIEEAKDILNRF